MYIYTYKYVYICKYIFPPTCIYVDENIHTYEYDYNYTQTCAFTCFVCQ